MHHQIALGDLRRIRDELISPATPARRASNAFTQQILFSRDRDAFRDEAALNPHHHQGHNICRQRARGFPIFSRLRTHAIFAQKIAKPFTRPA